MKLADLRVIATSLAALSTAIAPAAADVPSLLLAAGGGAPPGYYEPTYFDPDYVGDVALDSYKDPYAGVSDEALKAKMGQLNTTTVRAISTTTAPNNGGATVLNTTSRDIQKALQAQDSFGGPMVDPLSGQLNLGSEETQAALFYDTVDKKRWDALVEETNNRGKKVSADLQKKLDALQNDLGSTASKSGAAKYSATVYDDIDRDLSVLRDDAARKRNVLAEETKNANAKFLGDALKIEAQLNENEKKVWRGLIVSAVLAGTGIAGTALTESSASYVLKEVLGGAAIEANTAQQLNELFQVSTLAGVNLTGANAASFGGSDAAKRLLNLYKARISSVRGAYQDAQSQVQQLDALRNQFQTVEKVNESLYRRQTVKNGGKVGCTDGAGVCAMDVAGSSLDGYTWMSNASLALRSPITAPATNWFGPISQFDHRWINERSTGPISPFDRTWINARSTGPISEFDWSWMYANGAYGYAYLNSWTQMFPSVAGLPGAGIQDAYGGMSAYVLQDLQGLDMRQLSNGASRDAISEQLAAKLVREFGVDPAVGRAVADGTLILLTQALNQGGLVGGDSSAGFSNITLQLPLLFQVFDYATVDGDVITIRVTDQNGLQLGPVSVNLSGPAGADSFAPVVAPGRVEIAVTAQNEGLYSPNTGQIKILSTITSGSTTQQFSLETGQSGVLVITAVQP